MQIAFRTPSDKSTGRPFLHEMAVNNSCTNYRMVSLLQVGRQLHPPIFWGYPRKNMLDSTLQEPRCLEKYFNGSSFVIWKMDGITKCSYSYKKRMYLFCCNWQELELLRIINAPPYSIKMIYIYFCNSEEWILYCRPSDTLVWYPSSDVFGRSREFAWDKRSIAIMCKTDNTSYQELGNAVS